MKKREIRRKTENSKKPLTGGFGLTDQQTRRKEELLRRRYLKVALLAECPRDDAGNILCPRCLRLPDFRGLHLMHIKDLSLGGKTTRENCGIACARCHFGFGPGGHRIEGIRKDS